MDLFRSAIAMVTDPKNTKWLIAPLVLADALLTTLIVLKIPYTEIDWVAYMQQISQYIQGERDYAKIHGDTGPLVYPAAHVYIYRMLYAVTNRGDDIATAQIIFALLYLATLTLVLMCYRRAGAPPYLLPILVLSKRLHSIFMLRLFNDGFATAFFWFSIYCLQRRWWTLGSFAFSLGIGVKMSLLLALPTFGALLWQALGLNRAFSMAMLMGQLQVALGYPFATASLWSYLSRAFELTRQFEYRWTVNWRFIGEGLFLSRVFSLGLLSSHATLLYLFFGTRWLPASIPEVLDLIAEPPSAKIQARIARRVHPQSVLTMLLSAILIGCLCARSLHYQFYAYIFWATPFLLWRGGLPPILIFAVCAAQEWGWNVYPSTNASSATVVACLAVTVASIWFGTSRERVDLSDRSHDHKE